MKISMGRPALLLAAALGLGLLQTGSAQAITALSTEDFLNKLGVNTHLDGNSGWNTNASQVGAQLKYLGVRLDRDYITSPSIVTTWRNVKSAWSPLGRFWTSLPEGSPSYQQTCLGYTESAFDATLIYALGGPNEEDDDYSQGQGATLPDAASRQGALYSWAHSAGRNIVVSQMEFGAGWTASNNWQGDYNPTNPGINYTKGVHQNYTPGGANLGGAHTYISNANQTPVGVLNQLRALANLTTPGKPVAHTEFGDYFQNTTAVWGQYVVMGAFDSAAAGDAGYIVYGLQDSDAMGFYDGSGNAHEAATYYHTMTSLLASTSGQYAPGQTRAFTPGSLNVSYSNSANGHLLLQKPTGEFVIADWSEPAANSGQTSASDTVSLGQTFSFVTVYDIESGTTSIATYSNVSSVTLSMNTYDTYLIVASNKPPIGHRVALRSNASNYYVTCDLNGGAQLKAAWATYPQGWEFYDVVDAGSGAVGLKAEANNLFVTCNLNNQDLLMAPTATTIGTWEMLKWVPLGSGAIALLSSASNYYVTCNLNNQSFLVAGWATTPQAWEYYSWVDYGPY